MRLRTCGAPPRRRPLVGRGCRALALRTGQAAPAHAATAQRHPTDAADLSGVVDLPPRARLDEQRSDEPRRAVPAVPFAERRSGAPAPSRGDDVGPAGVRRSDQGTVSISAMKAGCHPSIASGMATHGRQTHPPRRPHRASGPTCPRSGRGRSLQDGQRGPARSAAAPDRARRGSGRDEVVPAGDRRHG